MASKARFTTVIIALCAGIALLTGAPVHIHASNSGGEVGFLLQGLAGLGLLVLAAVLVEDPIEEMAEEDVFDEEEKS